MFGVLAQLLNWCYVVWPNYLGMVLLFTLILMLVITPFTVKGMRSAAEMARVQPEIKKLQDLYKNDRIKQNEEMQALFKEHGVNPLGGCLPTLLPLPIFFIVFRLLERLNGHHTGAFAPLVRLVRHQVGGSGGYVAPHYLAYSSKLSQSIIAHGGALKAFGMDLAQTALTHHTSVGQALPYYILIVVMTGSQYWQQRQINQRNPAAANANPQMKMTMQLFPIFYAFISVRIPATVVFYLLMSGLFRMAQNYISYTYDPVLKRASVPIDANAAPIEAKSRPKAGAANGAGAKAALAPGRSTTKSAPAPPGKPQGSFMERLRNQAAEAKAQADRAAQDKAARPSANGQAAKAPPAKAPPAKAPPPKAAQPRVKADAAPGPAPEAEPAASGTPAADAVSDAGNGSAGGLQGGGNGAGRRSPLNVTRPSGRPTPPKGQPGRRPRKGQ